MSVPLRKAISVLRPAKPLLFFLGSVLLFSLLLFDKDFALSQNSYYHYRIASLYAGGNFDLGALGVLPSSEMAGHFINQHALYHFFLIPFVAVFKSLVALKIANAVMMSLLLLTLALVLDALKVKNAYLWAAVIPFVQMAGFGRLFWERPEALGAVCVLAAIHQLLTRRSRAILFFIAFAYSGFSYFSLLLLPISFLYLALERRDEPRFDWRPLLPISLGLLAGALVSFDPISNFRYALSLILTHTHATGAYVQVGEWEGSKDFLRSYPWLLLLLGAGVASLLAWPKQITRHRLFFAALAGCFCALTMAFVRFEYFFALFTGLFAASLWSEFDIRDLSRRLLGNLYRVRGLEGETRLSFSELSYVLLVSILIFLSTQNLVRVGERFAGASTGESVQAFYDWFKSSPYQAERFINYKWEYWSEEFYLDPRTTAEPGYSMAIYAGHSPDLFKAYGTLRGKDPAPFWNPSYIRGLTRAFRANHVLVAKGSAADNVFLQSPTNFTALYEDERLRFYHIQERPDLAPQPLLLSEELKEAITGMATAYLRDPRDPRAAEWARRIEIEVAKLPLEAQQLLKGSMIYTTIYDKDTSALKGCVSNSPGTPGLANKLRSALSNTLRDPRFKHSDPVSFPVHYHHMKIAILYKQRELQDASDLTSARSKKHFAVQARSGEKSAVILAEAALGYSSEPNALLRALRNKIGVDANAPLALAAIDQLSLETWPDGRPVEPKAEPSESSMDKTVSTSADAAVNFLLRMQKEDGSFYFVYDAGTGAFADEPQAKPEHLRKVLATAALCRAARSALPNATKNEAADGCRRAVSALTAIRPSLHERDDLGILSVLGLARLRYLRVQPSDTKNSEMLFDLRKRVMSYWDSPTNSFVTKLEDRSRHTEKFYALEALLFLASMQESWPDPEAQKVIDLAIAHYGQSYLKTHDLFMMRWLSEALIVASRKKPSEIQELLLEAIRKDASAYQYREFGESAQNLGCVLGKAGGLTIDQPNYVGGLILEGLAQAKMSPLLRETAIPLLRCALRQQFGEANSSELQHPLVAKGAFPTATDNHVVRVDLHAHVLNGLLGLLENRH